MEQPPKIFFKNSYRDREETRQNMIRAILEDEDPEKRFIYTNAMKNLKLGKIKQTIDNAIEKAKKEFFAKAKLDKKTNRPKRRF